MIDASMIPDEALEAMARPVTYPSGASVKYINALHIAAMLKAWPEMFHDTRKGYIMLPITEKPHD